MADPRFPRGGGANSPGGGLQHTIFPYFPKNRMKLKEIGLRGRGARPPLDLTLDLLVIPKHIFSLILFQISNIPFIVLPATLMVLSREYCARISRDMYMVCALLMVIGVSSAYFHATLRCSASCWTSSLYSGWTWVLPPYGCPWNIFLPFADILGEVITLIQYHFYHPQTKSGAR